MRQVQIEEMISQKDNIYSDVGLELYSCPECGKETLVTVDTSCTLQDGLTIPKVERLECSSCGAKFFSVESVRVIMEYRRIHKNTEAEVTV